FIYYYSPHIVIAALDFFFVIILPPQTRSTLFPYTTLFRSNEGRKVTIEFDMPFYAENPPKKWMNLGFNSILVEVDFFDIHEIDLQSIESKYRADIEIYKDEIDLVNM